MTIRELVDNSERNFDRNKFLTSPNGSSFTFEDVRNCIRSASGQLSSCGVRKSDRILLLAQNKIESVVVTLAAMYSGVVPVLLDPDVGTAIARYILDDCSPALVVCDESQLDLMKHLGWSRERTMLLDRATWLPEIDVSDEKPVADDFDLLDEDDAAAILYTSGSTGNPKGVVLSHSSLANSGMLFAGHYDWRADDLFLNLAGLHTMSGIRNTCISPLCSGTGVLVDDSNRMISVFSMVELISEFNCTLLGASPLFIKQIDLFLDRLEPDCLSSIRAVFSTGYALDGNLQESVNKKLGIPLLNYYGMTESTGICIAQGYDDYMNYPGSIGFAVGSEVQIVDEDGNELPPGARGELIVRSGNLMKGYFNNEKSTSEAIIDGWLWTGDYAVIGDSGEIRIVGRKKNAVNIGSSEIIYFEEVEKELECIDSIYEGAVSGFTSELGDERLIAFIVPKDADVDQQKLLKEVDSRLKERLGKSRTPHRYEITSSLPRNAAGKLLRRKLRIDKL